MREVVNVFVFHPLQRAQTLPKVSCLQELGRRLLTLLCTCKTSLQRCRLSLPHTREAMLTGSSPSLAVAGNSLQGEWSTPSTSPPEAAHDTELCSSPPMPSPGWWPATAQEKTHVLSYQLCYRGDALQQIDWMNVPMYWMHEAALCACLSQKCYPRRRMPGPLRRARTDTHTPCLFARELLSSEITQLYKEKRQLEMPSKKDLSLNYYLQNMSILCSLISFFYLFCRKDEALA